MIGFPIDSYVTYKTDGTPEWDRAISSVPLKKLIKSLFSDGVLPNPSTNLQVTAVSGETVKVLAGFGLCNGCLKLQEEDIEIEMPAADENYNRIDTIVLRMDDNVDVRACDFFVVKGNAASNPEAPTLTRGTSIWEIGLANIYRKAKSTEITNSSITDTRYDTERCGIISSISEFDTITLYQQIQTDLEEFRNVSQEEFNTWVENFQAEFTAYQTQKQDEFSQWAETFKSDMEEYQTSKESEVDQWTEEFKSKLDNFKTTEQTEYQTWEEEMQQQAEDFQTNRESEFDTWFNGMKDKLTEDQAGSLQTQIDEIKEEIVPDKTLTEEDAPADAKTVGDKLVVLEEKSYLEFVSENREEPVKVNELGIKRVAYGNGIYVGATSEAIYYSYDCIEWTLALDGITNITKVVFGEKYFVVTTLNANYKSKNGIDWVRFYVNGFIAIMDITHISNDKFMIVGKYAGSTAYFFGWCVYNVTAYNVVGNAIFMDYERFLSKVVYGNNLCVGYSSDRYIYVYKNAWRQVGQLAELSVYHGISFYKDLFILTGETEDGTAKAYFSKDGVCWNESYYSLEESISEVISNENDSFSIAVDSGKIYQCKELVNGMSLTFNTLYEIENVILDVCFSDDKFVIVTAEGVYTIDYLYEKTEMQTLLKDTVEGMNSGFNAVNEELEKINNCLKTEKAQQGEEGEWTESSDFDLLGKKAFGDGIFASSKGYYSYDGIEWFSGKGSPPDGDSIVFGNGIFAVLAVPYIYYSSDGITWNKSGFTLTEGGTNKYALVYGNGKFVISRLYYEQLDMMSFVSYYSSDADTWTEGTAVNITLTTATIAGVHSRISEINTLSYGNGKYLLSVSTTMEYSGYVNGYLVQTGLYESVFYYSADGKTWTKISIANPAIIGLTYGRGKYVAFDNEGNMYVSTNGTTWTLTTYSYGDYTNTLFNTNGYTVVGCSYVPDKYYICTKSEAGEYVLWESSNTTGWTQIATFDKAVYKLLYGNGTYICESDSSHYYLTDARETKEFHFDSFQGRYGFNINQDMKPENFVPFSPVIKKGVLTIEATTDPETFFPLECNNTYLLFTKEVNTSTGAIQGRRIITFDTSRTKTTGIGVITRTQVNASSASGVTVTDYKTEEKFGFSLKPSAVTYEVQYVLMKLM